MSSETYRVRIDEVSGDRMTLRFMRPAEPPFDDPVSPGLVLRALLELARSADLGATSLAYEWGDADEDDDAVLVARAPAFVARIEQLPSENEMPDWYDRVAALFGKDDAYDHAAYCAWIADDANLFHLVVRAHFTDPEYPADFPAGTTWSSVAYAPELYR